MAERQKRRRFTTEFKAEAVKRLLDGGKGLSEVATELGLSPEEAEAAFADRTVEVTGTAEEAEVRKTAREVGEVSLGKRVEEHAETVRDKVRRTEVEVEELETASKKRK